jgi:uncharacterized protein YciI
MKAFLICSVFLIMLNSFVSLPQNQTARPRVGPIYNDSTPKYEMKQYWLTFLYKGNNRTQDSATAARIQAAHLANIGKLAKEGKIIIAGPMGYDRDLRGIFIIDAKDSAEAASFIKTDSAIITGRLRFEIHPWWTAKGTYEFK